MLNRRSSHYPAALRARATLTQLLLTDNDGTLTNGCVYYYPDGIKCVYPSERPQMAKLRRVNSSAMAFNESTIVHLDNPSLLYSHEASTGS
jgi:hypothetical protein